MCEVCININRREVSVNFQKISVQVMREDYFMLNSVIYTPWFDFFCNWSNYNHKNSLVLCNLLLFSIKFNIIQFGQEWLSKHAHLLSILFIMEQSSSYFFFTISLHYCLMPIMTATGCYLSLTLIFRDLMCFLSKNYGVSLHISWKM